MIGSAPRAAGSEAVELEVVAARHLGRWAAAAVVLLIAAIAIDSIVTNSRFQWNVVGQYFASTTILDGLVRTLELTFLSMAIGIVLGVLLAVMRLATNPVVSGASWLYIWFFRGTPLLVQLIFWFNLSALYPRLVLGIPFGGPVAASANANTLITTFTAAILGLGLNEGAYMSEIVRAGIISVPHGQTEAALSLGMTRLRTMRRIVLPQAMRVIVPPTGNETISMLKTSSLVSVLALPELLYSAQIIYSRTFQTIPLLIVASLWYLIVTSVLTVVQYYIERHFGRGSHGQPPQTPLQRLRRNLVQFHHQWA